MKTILIAARKGGAGKTTLARHLGVAAAHAGQQVLLIDMDEQQSLRDWWDIRKAEQPTMLDVDPAPNELVRVLKGIGGKFDLVIVDTPPRADDWLFDAAKSADLVLVPVRPSPSDLRAIRATLEVIREAGTPYAFVLCQVRRTLLSAEAARVVAGYGALAPVNISTRVAYEESDAAGLTVQEGLDRAAMDEVETLWRYVVERLNDEENRIARRNTRPVTTRGKGRAAGPSSSRRGRES